MLKIESGVFEDSTVEAEFGKKGGLTRYKYIRNSPGEGAVNTLNDISSQVKEYKEVKSSKPVDDLTKENELLQLQIDNLKLLDEVDVLTP